MHATKLSKPSVFKLSAPETREFWEIPVLYEDESLLALAKPSGLLSSPDPLRPDRPDLTTLLHGGIARGAPWARDHGLAFLAQAHRLDFDTSGVVLLAKDKAALTALTDQFGSEKPRRIFMALATGTPRENAFDVDFKLAPHPAKPGVFRVDRKHGKKARTHFEVTEKFAGYTLLRCEPATARTDQIRVHLQASRLPLAGDDLYGGRPLLLSSLKPQYRLKAGAVERPLINRPALHALALRVTHPSKGIELSIEAPWPKDLTVAVKYLRLFATVLPAA